MPALVGGEAGVGVGVGVGAGAGEPHGGVDAEPVCVEGTRLCHEGAVYLCIADGTDLLLLASCAEGEKCDAATGSCRRVLSSPDACQVPVCKPSSSYCDAGAVYQCDSSGCFTNLTQPCGPDSHCEEYSGAYAACVWNECQAGQQVCDGDYLKTCTESGALPVEGIFCGDDRYCLDAACHDRDCEPNRSLCREGNLYYCQWYGGATFDQECAFPTACATLEAGAICVAPACEPGSLACVHNRIGTCAADGTDLDDVSQDCATAQEVCDASLACSASVTELVGQSDELRLFESGAVLGNVLEVRSDRRLLELEANLVLASPVELRWVVFEQIDQLDYQSRAERTVAGQSGAGFFGSGQLDYVLEAGKHYLLAVQVLGSSAVAYCEPLPWAAAPSFASARGGLTGSSEGPGLGDYGFDSYYLFALRLTTELP